EAIANSYVQHSRLQGQMFAGADRYGSFGFMALIVEPDFKEQGPLIRVGDVPTAHYTRDYLGRTKEYFEVYQATADQIAADYPEALPALHAKLGAQWLADKRVEVARFYDEDQTSLVLLEPNVI